MTHEGFSLYTNSGNRIMDHLSILPVKKLQDHTNEYLDAGHTPELAPTEIALLGLQHSLRKPLMKTDANRGRFLRHVGGVTMKQFRQAGTYSEQASGFADLDFTWHFAPAVASNFVRQARVEGHLTDRQVEELTLGDYANIIGAGWFSSLLHDMALTRNGVYAGYGQMSHDYRPTRKLEVYLKQQGVEANHAIFDISQKYEPEDGYTYLTASLAAPYKKSLRKARRIDGDTKQMMTRGCPVARHNITLPEDSVRDDPHTRELTNSGALLASDKHVREGSVHLTQQYSAIDRALALLADKIDSYEQMYGTPGLVEVGKSKYRWAHVRRESHNPMRTKS